jgi:hypothetical protein
MATAPKNVLVIGLKFGVGQAAHLTAEVIEGMTNSEVERAKEHGYNLTVLAVSPDEAGEMGAIREALRSKQWDGVSIGNGVRGSVKYTAWFEQIVNAVIQEVHPTPVLSFAVTPDKIVDAFVRTMPVRG